MDLEDDDNIFKEKPPYSPDLHLKTAIKRDERYYLLNNFPEQIDVVPIHIKESIHQLNSYFNTHSNLNTVLRADSENIYGHIFSHLPTLDTINKAYAGKLYTSHSISKLVSEQALRFTLSGITTNEQLNITVSSLLDYKIDAYTSQLYCQRVGWERIRDIMKNKQIDRVHKFDDISQHVTPYRMTCNDSFLLIFIKENCYLLDYNQVLMITDTVHSRYLSVYHCSMSTHMGLNNIPPVDILRELYNWGDKFLTKFGNDSYDTLKTFEALCHAVALQAYDSLNISKKFMDQLKKEVIDDSKLGDVDVLITILQKASQKPSWLFELMGCYRHFGHPTVDEVAGIDGLRNNTRENIEIDDDYCKMVSGSYKRNFIIQFIKKHQRWPKCYIENEETSNQNMVKLLESQPLVISEYDSLITLQDWHDIRFKKELDFDNFPDFTVLLSDKALSPEKEHWYSVYHRDLLCIERPAVKTKRRVLLEVLRRPEISCERIRLRIQSGDIPENWYIVGLHSKERELKIKSRLFAMMCLEMRLYFNMTEKNISDHIFKYLNEQTMTWSEAELTQTILNITDFNPENKKEKNTKFVNLIISLDFNKFNQKWRKESTDYIFQMFDDLFDTPGLYTFSHRFFEKAFFYLSSSLNPPDELKRVFKNDSLNSKKKGAFKKNKYPETLLTWLGQMGGCEGLRQKGWTAVIIGALLANEFITKIKSTIIGQGDNQVIVVSIPMHEEGYTPTEYTERFPEKIEERLKYYLSNLERITKGIGMDLKLEESWVSQRVFNYGKEIVVDGAFVSGSIKKICRAYQEVSDAYPSIQTRVSSLYTSAQSAALKGFDTIIPYHIANTETLSLFNKEVKNGTMVRRQIHKMIRKRYPNIDLKDKEFLLYLLICPKDCGGLPILPYPEMIFRGHPDPITSQLVWLKYLSDKFPIAQLILDYVSSNIGLSSKVDYTMLIQDPASINWDNPVNSANVIKQSLMQALSNCSKNRAVNKMMRALDKNSSDKFIEYLMTIKPCNPRVLNDIFRLSPEGAKMSFIATFVDMKTLKGMLPGGDARTLVNTLMDTDIHKIDNIIRNFLNIRKRDFLHVISKSYPGRDPVLVIRSRQKCTAALAQELRMIGWKLTDKQLVGVTTPHPYEQFEVAEVKSGACSRCSSHPEKVTYVTHPPPPGSIDDPFDVIFYRGPYKPYQGSSTGEKKSSPLLPFPKTDRAIRAAQQLLRTKDWACSEFGTLRTVMKKLIESRTEVPQNVLLMTSGENFGGSLTHRFTDVTTKHAGRPNIRTNYFSNIYFSSDGLGKYAKGLQNYYIFFQGVFLLAMTQLALRSLYYPRDTLDCPITYHQHPLCMSCLVPLFEEQLYTDAKPPIIKSVKDCPIIFSSIKEASEKISWETIEDASLIHPDPSDPLFSERAGLAAAVVIIGELSQKVTPIILSQLHVGDRERAMSSLTVGLFSRLSLRSVINSFSKLWLLENLSTILSSMNKRTDDVYVGASMYIHRLHDGAWDILKPFLRLPEIRDSFLREFGMVPHSSESFITGRSLGITLNLMISDCVKIILRDGDFNPCMYCTSPGYSIQKAFMSWISALFCCSYYPDLYQERKLLYRLRRIGAQAIESDNINFPEFFNLYNKLRAKHNKLICCKKDLPFILSRSGAETWLIPSKIEEHTQEAMTNTNIILISNPETHNILNTLSEIPLAINLEVCKEFPQPTWNARTDLGFYPTLQLETTKTRADHKYRLNGIYSTAFLKYSAIMCHRDVLRVNSTMHLAEGSGSVARAMVLLHGAKEIIYNSLVIDPGALDHRSIHFTPAELIDIHNGIKLRGTQETICNGGDITKRHVQEDMIRLIKTSDHPVMLATCDAETSGSFSWDQSLDILKSSLKIFSHLPAGALCIIKTFIHSVPLLFCQLQLSLCILERVKLSVPQFSSHESAEVFISGIIMDGRLHILEREGHYLKWMDNSFMDVLYNLQSRRINSHPYLDTISTVTLKSLFSKLNRVGFSYNVNYAIEILLNHLVSVTSIRQDVLRSLAYAEEISYQDMLSRLDIKYKARDHQKINVIERMTLYKKVSDRKELDLLSSTIFNSRLLRDLLIKGRILNSRWNKPMTLTYKEMYIYEYNPNWDLWSSKYGRSFNKVVGHLQMMNPNNLPH